MRLRRWIMAFFALGCVVLGTLVALSFAYRPTPLERTEIYRGVFLTVEQLPKTDFGSGRVMIVEIHWDTPGVRLANRAYSYPVSEDSPYKAFGPHYDLVNADRALALEKASVLINTTAYDPHSPFESLPGKPVRSVETLVVNGVPSHIHDHSYLLYWDEAKQAHLLRSKPPDEVSLSKAVTGISFQGIPVNEGRVSLNALASQDEVFDRTFIGIDPTRNILWLIAFENASAYLMVQRAVEEGVMFGGQVDSGSATHLLIGKDAAGIRPHTGIRNWRPLGPYLTVFAEPL